MKNSKSTKRALFCSVLAITLCFAMLIGSTYAWFTDTASTAVNSIQAGNLDVDLIGEDGKTLTDRSLSFRNADNSADILWEPGATYHLDSFRIVNNGNLALKYKVVITGLDGSAKLLEALEFTVVKGSAAAVPLAGWEDTLLPGAQSELITITGHMKEDAGNEYQELTIEGIGITVYATQDTVEQDGTGDQYDKNATYYPVIDMKGFDNALKIGGEIEVDADITVYDTDTNMWRTVITKPTTLNLNKRILSPDNMGDNRNNFAALFVGADTTINAGANGGINTGVNGAYAINVIDGATLTINGGYYYGGGTAVQVQKGHVVINGGTFACEPYSGSKGYNFLINCIDSAYADGSATVEIKGGTFINFNPAACLAEGTGTNFVADGYSVMSETKENGDVWYTVVKGTGEVVGTQEDANNAITNSPTKDITLKLENNTSVTLDNDLANTGAKSRNVTFVGDGSQTVDVITKAVSAEGGMLNYQRGSTFTFENLTIQAGEDNFDGIVCDELVYRNCTIKGKLTLYGKATFINCVFENTMANQYSIWTWGGTDVSFTDCVFNTNGKAILLYGQATAAKPTNLTVTRCTFNDRNNGSAEKAAIEVGNDYNATYTLTITDITVNGFAAGKNTGSKTWANKNSMDAAHLSVTIDGVKVQ